jgi:hypothetical protein
LLPTILFILGAYGLYALVLVWCRWQRSRFTGRRRQGRPRWLTLAGGAVFLGIFLCLTTWLAPSNPDQKMKLAGILGVSEGDIDLAKQASLRAATLHLEQKPPNGEPAYTSLHPESPPSLLPPAKSTLGAVPLHKPKVKRAGAKEPPKPRVEASLSKKDKAAAAKFRAKKKKPQPTTMNSKGSEGGNG